MCCSDVPTIDETSSLTADFNLSDGGPIAEGFLGRKNGANGAKAANTNTAEAQPSARTIGDSGAGTSSEADNSSSLLTTTARREGVARAEAASKRGKKKSEKKGKKKESRGLLDKPRAPREEKLISYKAPRVHNVRCFPRAAVCHFVAIRTFLFSS